jgi:hypothetical protein
MIVGIFAFVVIFWCTYFGYHIIKNMSVDQLEHFFENKLGVLAACLLTTIIFVSIFVTVF